MEDRAESQRKRAGEGTVSAETGGERGADGLGGLVGAAAAVGLIGRGSDGRVDGDFDGAVVREPAASRKDIVGAIDGYGDHGELEFLGELEGAGVEAAHAAVARAGTFGEDYHRHTVAEGFLGFIHGFADGCRG